LPERYRAGRAGSSRGWIESVTILDRMPTHAGLLRSLGLGLAAVEAVFEQAAQVLAGDPREEPAPSRPAGADDPDDVVTES